MSAINRKGITVRFEDAEMEQLEELAKRYHVSSATIIRWALKALADYVEINHGRIILPLDFTTFYQQAATYPAELRAVADAPGHQVAPSAGSRSYPKARRQKKA